MAKELKLSELKKAQAALQKSFNVAQANAVKVQKQLAKAKAPLVEFNNKYGRVLQLLDAA